MRATFHTRLIAVAASAMLLAAGCGSGGNDTVVEVPPGDLPAPANLKASQGTRSDGIELTWDTVPGATAYLVSAELGFGTLAVVNDGTAWLDSAPNLHFREYRVTALFGNDRSAPARATGWRDQPLSPDPSALLPPVWQAPYGNDGGSRRASTSGPSNPVLHWTRQLGFTDTFGPLVFADGSVVMMQRHSHEATLVGLRADGADEWATLHSGMLFTADDEGSILTSTPDTCWQLRPGAPPRWLFELAEREELALAGAGRIYTVTHYSEAASAHWSALAPVMGRCSGLLRQQPALWRMKCV
jgi:hypothetical protein